MKYRGCAYYPEWEVGNVEEDARRMQEAGLNMVRIGEFAWCRMEPSDGCYTLDWLHEAISILERYDIQILMCTPTATAPAWLTQAWPETLMVDKFGKRIEHGRRQHTCYVSKRYRDYCARITDKLSKELAVHKNVTAWQIDNEVGHSGYGNCHCEECQQSFRARLQKWYGSIENLNRRWGTAFWSMDYSDWSQIRLGDVGMHNAPSRLLDSARFFSATKVEFIEMQASIIRANQPQAMIATNNLSGIVNRFAGFDKLDRAGVDIYPREESIEPVCFWTDLYRSVKANTPFWVMEAGLGAGFCSGVPHNKRFRTNIWHHYVHGAEMALVFLWRPSPSGYEQDHAAILDHAGKCRYSYRDVQKCMLEFKRLQPQLERLPLPKAEVGIVFDYDILWRNNAGNAAPYAYESYAGEIHAALFRRRILSDIISPERPLDGYKLIILPSMGHIEKSFAGRLADFVAKGGIVLALGELGNTGPNADFLNFAGPEHLGELFGLSLEGRIGLRSASGADRGASVIFKGRVGGQALSGTAFRWIGDVELTDGRALMRFKEGSYEGQPALVEKKTGKGAAIYLATIKADDKIMAAILDYACRAWRKRGAPAIAAHIEMVERGDVTFLINHSNKAAAIPLKIAGAAITGNYAKGVARLAPYDVCAIKRSK